MPGLKAGRDYQEMPCDTCGRGMNPVEVMLGPTCGACVREAHARLMGVR